MNSYWLSYTSFNQQNPTTITTHSWRELLPGQGQSTNQKNRAIGPVKYNTFLPVKYNTFLPVKYNTFYPVKYNTFLPVKYKIFLPAKTPLYHWEFVNYGQWGFDKETRNINFTKLIKCISKVTTVINTWEEWHHHSWVEISSAILNPPNLTSPPTCAAYYSE